jgi:hypothetical protein
MGTLSSLPVYASQSIKGRRSTGSDILAVWESSPDDAKKMPVPVQELAILILMVEAGDTTKSLSNAHACAKALS